MIEKPKCFITIKAAPGKEKDLFGKILRIPEVSEVNLITGEIDIIVMLESKEVYVTEPEAKFGRIVEEIRKLDGVLETETIIPVASKIKPSAEKPSEDSARGFVFIDTRPRKEKTVMDNIFSKVEEASEVHLITGERDLLVVLDVVKPLMLPKHERIGKVVTEKIEKIKNIQGTETFIPEVSERKQ